MVIGNYSYVLYGKVGILEVQILEERNSVLWHISRAGMSWKCQSCFEKFPPHGLSTCGATTLPKHSNSDVIRDDGGVNSGTRNHSYLDSDPVPSSVLTHGRKFGLSGQMQIWYLIEMSVRIGSGRPRNNVLM